MTTETTTSAAEKAVRERFEAAKLYEVNDVEAWQRVLDEIVNHIALHVRPLSPLHRHAYASTGEETGAIATLKTLADQLVFAEQYANTADAREAEAGARDDDEVPL